MTYKNFDLIPHPHGKVFWHNADYPLYFLYLENNSYDYYLMCEYDAVLNIEIDEFVKAVDKDQVDYVGFPLAEDFRGWYWADTCDGVYPESFESA